MNQRIPLPAAHVQITPGQQLFKASENDIICNADTTTVEASAWFISGVVKILDGVLRVEENGSYLIALQSYRFPKVKLCTTRLNVERGQNQAGLKPKEKNLPRGCVSAVCRDFLPFNDDRDDVLLKL